MKAIQIKSVIDKTLGLFVIMFFLTSISYAQDKEQKEKGSKHIVINADVNGETIKIDTLIPNDVAFDEAKFLKELGLDKMINMNISEDHYSFEMETEEGDESTKQVKIEIDSPSSLTSGENSKDEKFITKTIMISNDENVQKNIMINNDDENIEIIKSIDENGNEIIKVLKDGKEMRGDKTIIKKRINQDDDDENINIWFEEEGETEDLLNGDKKMIFIKEDIDVDGDEIEAKFWIDENGKKHKVKDDEKVIIIKKDSSKKKK